MTLRLFPWVVIAASIAAIAFYMPSPEKVDPAAVSSQREMKGLSSLEIRLFPVDFREFGNDGSWNRLVASEAIYSYTNRTISGIDVTITMSADGSLRKIGESEMRAVRAFWDFEKRFIDLPDGGEGDSAQGWRIKVSPAVFNLENHTLIAPGRNSMSGPEFSVVGDNLRWNWQTEKILLYSPVSRILPSALSMKTP